MKKAAIPLHEGELRHVGLEFKAMKEFNHFIHIPHRDDHYMFLVQQKGNFLLAVDFNEVVLSGPSLCFITPGQVHSYINCQNCEGWFIFLGHELISNQYRELFDTYLHIKQTVAVAADDAAFKIVPIMEEMASQKSIPLQKTLINSLVDTLAGLIASRIIQSQNSDLNIGGQKYNTVVRFKQLIHAKYKALKQVHIYASLLHISPLYLNELTKEITGFPASYWINQEILLESKRLLYYTDLDVKQIAYELGFEDHAYFSRFFKKHTGMTASGFRSLKP
ncbi:AraC family transcriptional regulator [Pedobacter cryoconitis]|uniref:AraC family transcriptional regulator n=1 Tax=Pedobacter cryoconitis TaxID=188932 RepID=A0A127V9W7_9SPHI|nr:helix-turn-helix transcriptional regulator [Pedobacter cryoconitis]AMP98007.1 AraC family transcriptional regulator [Pedobacter cryoconitis]